MIRDLMRSNNGMGTNFILPFTFQHCLPQANWPCYSGNTTQGRQNGFKRRRTLGHSLHSRTLYSYQLQKNCRLEKDDMEETGKEDTTATAAAAESSKPATDVFPSVEKVHQTTSHSGNPEESNVTSSAPLSKNAQKKLLKQKRYEEKKAEKKAQEKEQKKKDKERKRQEWEEKLANVSEEEKAKLIEARRGLRAERMEHRSEERGRKIEKLKWGIECGQNIVIDLDFSHLMTPTEINSLSQQIMYCYAVNGRSSYPSHLWLTGLAGDMGAKLNGLPGFDKWIIEKETGPYIEALKDKKDHLVYLTADAETVLDDLDPTKFYIIGGLVDRNRWKGLTLKKAEEQGIQAAKLPIGSYWKLASSQVLTVNQVLEILIKYVETRDWRASFFQVIPQRKRCDVVDTDEIKGVVVERKETEDDDINLSLPENQKKIKTCEAEDLGKVEDGIASKTENVATDSSAAAV